MKQRVIKFRVWRTDIKSMIQHDHLIEYGWFGRFGLDNDIVWMQYTDRKDINKILICECDIVKFIAAPEPNSKSEAIGVIRWDDEDCGFYIDSNDYFFPHVKFCFAENIEVIGNEFEHPHLLNQQP
jgi:hypothetical protein